jgi:hypothetical protein
MKLSKGADSKFIEAVSGAGSRKADCRSAGAPRTNWQPWRLSSPAYGIFPARRDPRLLDEFKKIDRSTPIVAETEQIAEICLLEIKSANL